VTSKPGGRPVAVVAADGNVLLSAVLGHAALKIFTQTDVEVVTTEGILEEVGEYLPLLAKKYDMLPEALEAQLRLLALRTCGPDVFGAKLGDAERAIGARDPDDAELLALALALEIPVWSNDDDFKRTGVEWHTTARLPLALYR
jgi:predicted nucleic acid-binding protein